MKLKRRQQAFTTNHLSFQQLEPRQLLATLANGQEIVSSIGVGGSESFEVEATDGQRVSIAVGEVNNFGQPFLTILDPTGAVLGTNTTGNDSASLTFNATQNGTYTAIVTDDGNNQQLSFRIRALTSPSPAELIPGRDQALASGEEATATVPLGGFNLFPLEATAGQRVSVSVGEINNFGQPFLTILSPTGTVIGTNTDANDAAALTFNATQSGTYTAIVTDDGNNQQLSFRIRTLTSPAQVELIPGRDQVLISGEEATATVPLGGFNLFPLEATAGQRVSVSVGEINNFGQPLLTILGPTGAVLGTNTNANDSAALTFNATQSGTYTAIVTDDGNNQQLSFRIRALTSPAQVELIPGRDQALASGEEATATVPLGGFNLFPVLITAGQEVSVSVTEIGNFGQPFLTVLSPAGNVLATNTNSADAAFLNFIATQTGLYTAIVSDDQNDQSFSFSITATGTTQLAPEVIRFRRDGQTNELIDRLARPDQASVFDVSFNQDVDVSASDFTFFNETTGASVGIPPVILEQAFSYDATSFTVTFDFTPFLPSFFQPGLYSISAPASSITAVSDGRPLVEDFSQQVLVALPGDANLDGQVDVLGDAFALVGNLGTTSGATWQQGDFNGDGMVDVLNDAFALVANLGQNLIPAGSSLSKTASLASTPLPTASKAVVIPDTDSEEDDKVQTFVSPLDAVFSDDEEILVLA